MIEATGIVGNIFSIYKVLYNYSVTIYDSIGTSGQIPDYCEPFTIASTHNIKPVTPLDAVVIKLK